MKYHGRASAVLLLGAWLSLAPFLFDYPHAVAIFVTRLTGLAIILFAALAVLEFQAWETWAILVLAVWLISVPSALGFAGQNAITWNSIVVGAAIGATALSLLMRSNDLSAP